MKHILICLICAVLLFTYIGRNTIAQDTTVSAAGSALARVAAAATTPNNATATAARMAPVNTTLMVGIVVGHADDIDTTRFKNSFEKNIGTDVKVNCVDATGNLETQKTMFDKMITSGYSMIVLELMEGQSGVEGYMQAAQETGIPLVLIGEEPDHDLLARYPSAYYLGFSDDDIIQRMAEETLYFWQNNPEMMDFENDDWDLTYSSIASTGFADAGFKRAFEAAMYEQSVSTSLAVDSVIQVYEYDLHKEIDQTIIDDSEIVFYDSSTEAQKAINYFYDPTEFSKRPKQQLALSVVDDGAAQLVQDQEVLFAVGTDTSEMGRVAARLAGVLLAGQTPSFQNMERQMSGQCLYLPITVLRADIPPEPVEEEAASES